MINNKWFWALLVLIAFTFFSSADVKGWLDCTPSTCPPNYQDNGTICEGGECVRQCITYRCVPQWSQVSTETFGWTSEAVAQEKDFAAQYTANNLTACYQFFYDGAPAASDDYIKMFVNDPPINYNNCDSEGIGGFHGGNNWLSGMHNYTGDVNGNEYDNLVKAVRGTSVAGSTLTGQNYKPEMAAEYSIYCVPNTSVACSEQFEGTNNCDNDCYNTWTDAYVTQGYFETASTDDQTLYNDLECNGEVSENQMSAVKYIVYTAPIVLTNETNDQICNRVNEAPQARNVQVIPTQPNAGQDLECNFTYIDPENFQEKNSSYEWWKNAVNQNINSRTLLKGNLSVGNVWFCKVTPSDGLIFGTKNQSTNNVTILTTVKNPMMKVNNIPVWNESGFYEGETVILDFSDELNSELNTCTPDATGFCDIPLNFSSEATGTLKLTDLKIYYKEEFSLLFNFTNLTSKFNDAVFAFTMLNNNLPQGNFSWILNFGDNASVSSTIGINLQNQEDAFVIAQHAYNAVGTYTVQATVTNGSVQDQESLIIQVTP